MSGLTLIEKIATAHAVGLRPGQAARAGDIITIRPTHVMTHDNTSAVISKFNAIGATAIHDPRQPVFALDHDIQNTTPVNVTKYATIEAFARRHGIDFYPAGTGISHQVMMEQGYVAPGSMVVGSDSHSNLYGAGACLGTPVVRTDAAALWATGVTWWQVPAVARCTLTGHLPPGVAGKDVIIALCGLFNDDEVLNMAVEFTGDGVAGLSMDQRMTIANMTTEWGALAGVFPFDAVLRDELLARADHLAGQRGAPRFTRADVDRWWGARAGLTADPDAQYAVDVTLDLATLIPQVAGPDDVKTMTPLPEIERRQVRISKAYLLSCVNARLEDLAAAADVLAGRRVAPGVELYVAAASASVQQQAEQRGYWQTLLDAGAIALPAGCGPCIGLGRGLLEPGDVGISATNRNFKGRMGHRDAQAYLASPAVVAASAAAGYICGPMSFAIQQARHTIRRHPAPPRPAGLTDIIAGFPAVARGRVLWLPADNITTDGIYSGQLTYRDDVPPATMAAAAFANYDPGFQQVVRPGAGDIIVAGRNFGAGSSREQAATCLLHLGIAAVIAASFSETYKRNAFNNGLAVFECPPLVDYLRRRFAGRTEATITGSMIEIDYRRAFIRCDGQDFPFPPLSATAQELIVAGGAEQVARRRLGLTDGGRQPG